MGAIAVSSPPAPQGHNTPDHRPQAGSIAPRGLGRHAVFLDRDGTINEEVNYLGRVEDMRWLPGAREAICALEQHGWLVVLVTNQSGIGRGYYTTEAMQAIHARMQADLAALGAGFDAIYYCPHTPEQGCACRKPRPELFQQAVRELGIDLRQSYAVGDKLSDLLPGRELGCGTVLVLTGYGPTHAEMARQQGFVPDHVAQDLGTAVEWITAHENPVHL
jgi:D-glycero-D-manno-heptose 1,7-bisphosphate phosphatase